MKCKISQSRLSKGLVRVRGRSGGQMNVRCMSGESQSELDVVGRKFCNNNSNKRIMVYCFLIILYNVYISW